jgi:hypothetical protein
MPGLSWLHLFETFYRLKPCIRDMKIDAWRLRSVRCRAKNRLTFQLDIPRWESRAMDVRRLGRRNKKDFSSLRWAFSGNDGEVPLLAFHAATSVSCGAHME